MAKRLKGVSTERQNDWYTNHRDSFKDTSRTYEPFWRCEDVPSWGVKTKIAHFDTKYRIVHLLSQNELWMYLQLVQNPLVLEIYEQFAIPLEDSLAIAEGLGVKHPNYPRTTIPMIQTIDFLCDMFNPLTGEIHQAAFPVKQTSDALRERNLEKLAIQETFSRFKKISYELITSECLRTPRSVSLECLYRYRNISPLLIKVSHRWIHNFFGHLSENSHERTAHILQKSSHSTGVDYLTGISIFYNALWHKKIEMNWNLYLKLDMPASELGLQPNV